MAGASLKVHVVSRMKFKPLEELAGFIADDVVEMYAAAQEPTNGNGPPKLFGIAFTDLDNEAHVYVVDEAGKQALIQKLTGGVVLPT